MGMFPIHLGNLQGSVVVPSRRRISSLQIPMKKRKAQVTKTYARDIMCIPDCESSKRIPIPRGEYRKKLCEMGLVGKITLSSDMSPEDIKEEICSIFSDVIQFPENSTTFPFEYLQSSGGGSRSLCIPKVSSSFVWNAQQVASLGRNSAIYILAKSPMLPPISKVYDTSLLVYVLSKKN